MQFSLAIEQFLHALEARAFSARTIDGYRADLTACLGFVAARTGSDVPMIDQIDAGLIRDFVAAPGPSGRSPSPAFRNRRLSAIRSFFSYLRETGEWSEEMAPDRRVPFARLPKTRPSFLHYDEYLAMLEAVRGTRSPMRRARNSAILVTLFNTGLRLRELVSLDLWQFNTAGSIFSAVHRKGRLVQDVVLNRNVVNAVSDWLTLRSKGDGPLFVGRGGRRISPRAVQRIVTGYARAASIKQPVTVHTLRHTFCSEAQRRGASIEVARRLMAHQALSSTLRYTHARDDELRHAVQTLDDPRTWHVGIEKDDRCG